ncbi:hypothetical protein KYK30_21900 [Shinella yambaruensis]|uniref:C2H2-type domain-containing protein n=1 Tax=Shinella yambaruensis TaxID=415996 RepID=A0ABQ5ZG71_9HYPH|nr:hypothetical protein [Shinella yambaruensis]MCJ8026564.1 hypothetical protein [Shinella yambaruensis]MCU7982358.1 hypothetical protein [Shinella yambaruensis]GLR51820.1 hypothetical protein GCM10007923_30300 [Shinella yambaruensis]
MKKVDSFTAFEKIRSDPNNAGRTFSVSKDIFDHFSEKLRQSTREIGAKEASEIEDLIGADPGKGAGTTRDATCEKCNTAFSLSDHVASALLAGKHTAPEMASFFQGNDYWLTVDTKEKRETICPHCYRRGVIIHCCYIFSRYAYA